MIQYLKPQLLWLFLLALVSSFNADGQVPEGYYIGVINSANFSHSVGTGSNSFSILTGGSYDGFTYGIGIDNFIGPNGLPGAQEIGGVVAPIFDTLLLNNGINAFSVTNTAGVLINGSVAFNNSITTTLRTNRAAGLAGAIKFLGNAIYTPVLTPVAGSADIVFTDGFVSKVNPVNFVYPVGNVTDLRPITATGTGTFVTAWSNINVATSYPYNTATLPIGTSLINTNGYWEWSGTASATAILSIPDESSFTTANKLSILAYNGTAWTNLGGVFSKNVENSTNAAPVTIPATTIALAIGQSVPFVLVSPKAFLQGAMRGSTMTTALRSWMPLAHPYNVPAFGNYAGTETLSSIPINMTDWILVDIRDSATATTIVASKAAILMNDGSITDVDGVSPVSFLGVTPGNYYIGLRHRNHLAFRSANLISLGNTTTSADFRTEAANAYTKKELANLPLKNMGNGTFAMWGGNGTGGTSVRAGGPPAINAYLYIYNSSLSGNFGSIIGNVYNNGDYNMDGILRAGGPPTINDYLFLYNNVLGGDFGTIIQQHL